LNAILKLNKINARTRIICVLVASALLAGVFSLTPVGQDEGKAIDTSCLYYFDTIKVEDHYEITGGAGAKLMKYPKLFADPKHTGVYLYDRTGSCWNEPPAKNTKGTVAYASMKTWVANITKGLTKDYEKLVAIYVGVMDRDSGFVYGHDGDEYEGLATFDDKVGVCEGFNKMGEAMLRIAGIPAFTVSLPKKIHRVTYAYVQGKWRYVDFTTGIQEGYNPLIFHSEKEWLKAVGYWNYYTGDFSQVYDNMNEYPQFHPTGEYDAKTGFPLNAGRNTGKALNTEAKKDCGDPAPYIHAYELKYYEKQAIKKITTKKKSITAKWAKAKISLYKTKHQLAYRLKGTKKWNIKNYSYSKTSATIKKLTTGKMYEVRMRVITYTLPNKNEDLVSTWSRVRTVRVK
jgi:hypothetical protein